MLGKINLKNENDVPVLLIIFNRPEKVKNLIQALRKVKPKKIFVAADGARDNNLEDLDKCNETRELINSIDWDCEIKRKFSDKNLGLSLRMETAIDWFFENNEYGIIFEDDCIPHPDFFRFSYEMLEKYKNNKNVMMVSGTNYQKGIKRGDASYYFSKYATIWGWATWKRAWEFYNKGTTTLPDFIKQNKITEIFDNKKEQDFWINNFKNPYIDPNGKERLTWATTWAYSLLKNKGLTIVPNVNLVQNIGYGYDSTHTRGSGRGWSFKTEKLGEIEHPKKIEVSNEADAYYFKTQHYKTVWDKFYNDLNVFLDFIKVKPLLIKILQKFGLR